MSNYPRIAAGFAIALSLTAYGEIAFESPRIRIVINDDATLGSLVEQSSGRECANPETRRKIADVTVDGKGRAANSATPCPGGFQLKFAGTDTVLKYRVETADDWIVFRLASVSGARPTRVTMLRVPVSVTENVGRRLNLAHDERTAVCLMAANRQPDCGARVRKGVFLVAATQDSPGPKLEGCAVALMASPTSEFKAIARKASHAFGLLTNEDARGVPVKDTDLVRGSYFFLSFGEKDVDKVIDYCNRAGIRQVMMSSGAWCAKVGHYIFNERRYPNGVEGLKSVVDKLHANGILVGMHTFVSKISKTDPYVTPKPDRRFWQDMQDRLAQDVTAEQTEIRVAGDLSQWPGSPVCAKKGWEGGVGKHREVIIGDEIIQYEAIGPEGKWDTFLGCRRGAWGAVASAHKAGAQAVHFGVDGCINGYIIDQETDLMDEVADRIAGIFNHCGFDMVYFDGGEDVDRRRFNYYVSNFQEQAMKRFAKRPVIHMGTVMTHLLWHSFARSSTVDTYLNTLHGAIVAGRPPDKWPTVKDHINRSVRYMLRMRAGMMPGELGWFGIWPKGKDSDGLQLDEMEYLMCKSLGYDVPVSLQTGFGAMESHVLTPEILNIFKQYEELRLARTVSSEARLRLQTPDRDFAMVRWQGETHFVEVDEVPLVGGTHDVRAMVGAFGEGSVATLWHYLGEGTTTLALDPAKTLLIGLTGERLPLKVKDGKVVVPADSTRHTLVCRGVSPDALKATLAAARVWVRPPKLIFIRASEFTELTGEMAKGSEAGVTEPDAFGDVIVCTGRPHFSRVRHWYVEYTVDIPYEARWAFWARVRYPSGADDSFALVRPDEEVTLKHDQVLGNCGVNEKKWHWTGRGSGSAAIPPGRIIVLKLDKGPFTFRIYGREGPGAAALNPRLDLLCLCDDPGLTPTDEHARKALGGQ